VRSRWSIGRGYPSRVALDPFAAAAALEGVPSAFAAARDGIDSLLRDRGLRRSSPAATAESLLRGAHSSAALEGSGVTLEQLRAGKGDQTALAIARLSTQTLGLLPVWQRSPLQALARLHTVAAAGHVTPEELGRPGTAAAAGRLQALARSLAETTQAPAMVVAAIVHAEVVAAAAFASHNAVIARAAERLVLVSTGLDPASITVPEAGHLAHRHAYAAGLADYREGKPSALHAWLLHAAAAYAAGAEAAADLV